MLWQVVRVSAHLHSCLENVWPKWFGLGVGIFPVVVMAKMPGFIVCFLKSSDVVSSLFLKIKIKRRSAINGIKLKTETN